MAMLIAVYKTPEDAAAFDAYYETTHVPLAKSMPGLRSYSVSTGTVGAPPGQTVPHLVAMLEFDSLGAIQAALGSPEGQATAADLGKFAQAGVDLLMFDTKRV